MKKIKLKKRGLLSLIIAVVMVISAVNMTVMASAEEIQADLVISTVDDLKKLRDEVNNGVNNYS